jgi:hypothetical protein
MLTLAREQGNPIFNNKVRHAVKFEAQVVKVGDGERDLNELGDGNAI